MVACTSVGIQYSRAQFVTPLASLADALSRDEPKERLLRSLVEIRLKGPIFCSLLLISVFIVSSCKHYFEYTFLAVIININTLFF